MLHQTPGRLLVALALSPAALAGSSDYYLSAPAVGAIWRVDADTGVGAPFATGVLIPHYGWFSTDGTLYMPDRGWPALLEISPTGVVGAVSAGGEFIKPVTCIPSLDGQALIMSDMEANKIFRVEFDGTQTLLADNVTSGGMFDFPDGMAYDDDGNLYVANLGGHDIVKMDPQGNVTLFSASPLINQPGGIAIDGAGNLFVANYGNSTIARFRLDTAVGEVFAADESKMKSPNDLKLSRRGGLLTSTRQSNVCRIDALGNIDVEFHDPILGEIVGVAVPEDATLCTGRFKSYGQGTPGSGGIVPQFRAIFSPCPGQLHGFEWVDFMGGAPTVLLLGYGDLAPGVAKVQGASLLVDPSVPMIVVPLMMPGSGAGNGDLRLQFQVPQDANLIGANLYFQVLAGDPGAPFGVSASNGLHETIGS